MPVVVGGGGRRCVRYCCSVKNGVIVCENGPWLHTLRESQLKRVERILRRRGRVEIHVYPYDVETAFQLCVGEDEGEEEDEAWGEAVFEAGWDCAVEVRDSECDVLVVRAEGSRVVLEGGRVRYSLIRRRGEHGGCEETQPLPEGEELCVRSLDIPRREFENLRELVDFLRGLLPDLDRFKATGRGIVGRLITEADLPPYDSWLRDERCPMCGAVPVIVSYVSGDMGLDVVLRCPRCGLTWGINEG